MAYFLKDNTSPYEITNLLDSAELLKWLFVGKKKKKGFLSDQTFLGALLSTSQRTLSITERRLLKIQQISSQRTRSYCFWNVFLSMI